MRLRVKDLRQYLQLRNIPTDTCREKEDLVDLVLRHQGIEEEEEDDPDTASLRSRSLYTTAPSTTQSASELSAFAASQEEPLSRSDSSDTNQVRTDFNDKNNLKRRKNYFICSFYSSFWFFLTQVGHVM